MNLSLEELEQLLLLLLTRFKGVESLLSNIGNQIVVLQHLILEVKRDMASGQGDEPLSPPAPITENTAAVSPCGRVRGRTKRVIEAVDVHTFLHRASLFLDYLQSHFRIHIKYAWYCRFICLRFSLKRQRGGIPGSDLSPTTILSYFKKERAGEY